MVLSFLASGFVLYDVGLQRDPRNLMGQPRQWHLHMSELWPAGLLRSVCREPMV